MIELISTPKIRDIRKIEAWEDADRALGVLRQSDALVAGISAAYDAQIQVIQEAKQKAVQPHIDRTERVAVMLETFVLANRATLGKKPTNKSRKLVHGTVGFKKGKDRLVFVQAEEWVRARLKARNQIECIVTTEKLDNKAIAALPPSEMALIGAKISTGEDEFYYKLNTDAPIEYPDVEAEK